MFKERQLMTAAHGGAKATAGYLCHLSGLLLLEKTTIRQLGKPLLLCPTSSLHSKIVGIKIRRCRQRI